MCMSCDLPFAADYNQLLEYGNFYIFHCLFFVITTACPLIYFLPHYLKFLVLSLSGGQLDWPRSCKSK